MSKDAEPRVIRLQDYRPPTHFIDATELHVEIGADATQVTATLQVRANPDNPSPSLRLDGQALELQWVKLNGDPLSSNQYQLDAQSLTLLDVPTHAQIEIATTIYPAQNTALEGLYQSGGMYCTQCEAEGFRKITYYLDRPDVLARFRTSIVADGEKYPVLLSNGNLLSRQQLPDGRLQCVWEDPFPKPAYLFALVAGDLALLQDSFTTASGREIELRIYSEPHNIGQCDFAMAALKRAMRWDEEVYGREYDLDIFMIVAVEDFNMGAMENKGLNIFNTSCVLATADTATDLAHQHVEAVVAHEYFHNWSGNRVTCRDWFQLSLKEGFTVFRDAEFSADMGSRTVKRIEDVQALRTHQFAEDAGPLAHPVRPDNYQEISNFYTRTVYDKGAEVVRMLATLLGPARFRQGTDLYFSRHDGQAVTTEDFVCALEAANDLQLTQFRHWYSQAGTPVVAVTQQFADGVLTLDIRQHCPPTPGQPEKAPLHIPLAFGLLDAQGQDMLGAAGAAAGYDLQLETDTELENPRQDGTLVLHLRNPQHQLRIRGLKAAPELSLLRGFSAPVRLQAERSAASLSFLALHDSDGFSRWDAMMSLHEQVLAALAEPGRAAAALTDHGQRYQQLLEMAMQAPDDGEAKAMLAAMLAVPEENYLYEQATRIDVDGLHQARNSLVQHLGRTLFPQWLALYAANGCSAYAPTSAQIARRGLKNLALSFLVAGAEDVQRQHQVHQLLRTQFQQADNLTDRLAALRELLLVPGFAASELTALLAEFYQRWQQERLVIDRWFAVQASAPRADALAQVEALEAHPAFERRNPNRVRSLYAAFASQNPARFHALDGSGYQFLASRVLALDATNPQLASRLLTPLTRWQRFDERRQRLMCAALREIAAQAKLSPDVLEVVSKSLLDAPKHV